MDVSQYLGIFLDETDEHLQSLNEQIMTLENEPENQDCINEIFRIAHTIKGMAGTMGYKRMQNLTHDMENVFSAVRDGTIKVEEHMIDVLFKCLDALETYAKTIRETSDEGTEDNASLIKELNDILNGGNSSTDAAPADAASAAPAKEEAKAQAAADSGDGEKWKTIALDNAQKDVLEEAIKQNKKVFELTVYIQQTCILKAARAFLVYKTIEELGEILVSAPSAQDIEDEKFDFDFSLIIVTDKEIDEVIKAASNVSEIEKVLGGAIDTKEIEAASSSDDTNAKSAEKAPEAAAAKPAAASAETKPVPAQAAATAAKKPAAKPIVNRTVRVDIEKLDVLMNLVSELIIAKNSLVAASSAEGDTNTAVNEQVEYLESVTTSLHESVMKVRMVPIESVVNKFPRMIRDLSKKLNKPMELYMTGEDTELDRTVVDEIGDPLMHLLRNAADHGLESPEVRKQENKPETGSIFLNAYQDGNNVVIEVRDDGAGIDVESVKAKAVDRGVVTQEQADAMTEKEAIALLFDAGFSMSKVVTDVSGRGVGLDVVKSKIESLSGEVEVKNKLGEGSSWIIRLPLTLAIIQTLMVTIGNEKYAISLGSIETIEDVQTNDIKLVQNKEVINLRGNVIPLIRLHDILDIPQPEDKKESLVVVIVKKGDNHAGLIVDELIGQQEIVIKSMGKFIKKSKIISGATILGDGEVALILDANALL
ncbi:MAG: chemotaxis protein CheA [Lachnospiraceae bacterium]|jgi:two-component system chemotaxis sensor kinase CheA|nr:chemotaxis protein CheA [Lachnospiraceae bacterium]